MAEELIPGLSDKIRKWNGDQVSKIKELIKHMRSQEVPMTAISVKEAAKITNSTEAAIQSHLSPNKWFSKMKEKGMYALLDKPRKYKNRKARMADIEKKHKEIETETKPPLAGYYGKPKKAVTKEDAEIDKKDIPLADKNSDDGMAEMSGSIAEKQMTKTQKGIDKPNEEEIEDPDYGAMDYEKNPLQIITRTVHYCPHCDKEISIPEILEKKGLKDPLQLITKTAYFCPHCDKEISIKDAGKEKKQN